MNFRREVHTWVRWFGVAAASLSIVSLVQRLVNLELNEVFTKLVQAFRAIAHAPFNIIAPYLPLSLPDWYKDSFALSFLIMATIIRTSQAELRTVKSRQDEFERRAGFPPPNTLLRWVPLFRMLGAMIGSLFLVGLFRIALQLIFYYKSKKTRNNLVQNRDCLTERLSQIKNKNQTIDPAVIADVEAIVEATLPELAEGIAATDETISDTRNIMISLFCALAGAVAFIAMNSFL